MDPQEDRLSSLPDALLIHILSFLPIQSSATTSTLSHRWNHLWTHPTHLRFDYHLFRFSTSQEFLTRVAHILGQLSSSRIQSFTFHFPVYGPRRVCSSYLSSWVPQLSGKHVQELEIGGESSDDEVYIRVPTCVFECKSLIRLKLYGDLTWELPDDVRVINLPNLKTIDLSHLYSNLQLVRVLFKSCPLLESVTFALRCGTEEVVEVLAPNLKLLYVTVHGVSNRMKFVIDAPLLEDIRIGGSIATYSLVQKPKALLRANISQSGWSVRTGNDYHSRVLELLRVISSVRLIHVSRSFGIFDSINIVNKGGKIVFPDLEELCLTCCAKDMFNWDDPIPRCLLGQLKRVRLESLMGEDIEIKLVECILSNANALEKLYVAVGNYADTKDDEGEKDQLWKEFKFCRKLFKLSKSSPACKVEFFGKYIRGSSNGSKDGWLASQINCLGLN